MEYIQASLLRKIVAGGRSRHEASNLDLCYVTDNIIATSGPSGTFPKRTYRNPLDSLITFLDKNHKDQWAIWEFRAEGTGYPDDAVYGRVWHYPWPDHHPPPFGLIPNIMASMRNWLKEKDGRVVVVHCKAGKGRSGTASCSYLISEEGWSARDAIDRFTERRMRPGWSVAGVSIPSQLRWLGYVDRWKQGGKIYVERKVEVLEVHVWGLREGVTFCIRGFIDEGKTIKVYHTFVEDERVVVRGEVQKLGFADAVMEFVSQAKEGTDSKPASLSSFRQERTLRTTSEDSTMSENRRSLLEMPKTQQVGMFQDENRSIAIANGIIVPKIDIIPATPPATEAATTSTSGIASTFNEVSTEGAPAVGTSAEKEIEGADAIFRPKTPILLETNDINIRCEGRAAAFSFSVQSSVAHVWFNTFFEGGGPEQAGLADDSGVFEIDFNKMDGVKGSERRGTTCFERLAVVWKARDVKALVTEPKEGEAVQQTAPADWRGADPEGTAADISSDEEGTQSFVPEK